MSNILDIQHVYKHYSGHTALSDVSIAIPKNSIFGLLGPNGAGKTSLIRIITQITAADEGKVFFNGEHLQPKHIASMGYLPEERGLYKKMAVGEHLLYLARLKGMPQQEATKRIKLWGERFEMQTWWKKNIEDLSKGMQQKVQFIATVLHEPELIILDEPFSGFDPINANLIKREILELRNRGCTIIFSTHRMESVEELCDNIALINRSQKVLDGPKKAIKDQFRSGIFVVETDKPVAFLGHQQFELIDAHENTDGLHVHRVRIKEGTTNDLLSFMMERANLHGLRESLPSMNEIFISIVGESNAVVH